MRSTRLRRDELGSSTVEFVLLMPVLILFLLFVVALGRFGQARADVDGAARDGARAASIVRNRSTAVAQARDTAEATLRDRHVTCAELQIDTDTSAFQPGGQVTVSVTCSVKLSDLAVLGVGGSRTFRAQFVSPIDRYRATA